MVPTSDTAVTWDGSAAQETLQLGSMLCTWVLNLAKKPSHLTEVFMENTSISEAITIFWPK